MNEVLSAQGIVVCTRRSFAAAVAKFDGNYFKSRRTHYKSTSSSPPPAIDMWIIHIIMDFYFPLNWISLRKSKGNLQPLGRFIKDPVVGSLIFNVPRRIGSVVGRTGGRTDRIARPQTKTSFSEINRTAKKKPRRRRRRRRRNPSTSTRTGGEVRFCYGSSTPSPVRNEHFSFFPFAFLFRRAHIVKKKLLLSREKNYFSLFIHRPCFRLTRRYKAHKKKGGK